MKFHLKLLNLKITITQQFYSFIFYLLSSLGTFVYLHVQVKAFMKSLVSKTWSCRTLLQHPSQKVDYCKMH